MDRTLSKSAWCFPGRASAKRNPESYTTARGGRRLIGVKSPAVLAGTGRAKVETTDHTAYVLCVNLRRYLSQGIQGVLQYFPVTPPTSGCNCPKWTLPQVATGRCGW